MKKIVKLISTGLLLLMPFYASAQTPQDEEIVRQSITAFMKQNNIPGAAVELYVNGKPESYYFGYADQEKKTPITKNTIFEVGSITKIMTSILLAQQVDAAKVQLNDPVTKFLPGLPEDFEDVTLKNLATHTAGLPFKAPESVTDRTQLEKYLNEMEPTPAGEKWAYSNFGIGLLGYALETSTNKSFDQLYRTQILSPLKMQPIALTVPKKLSRYYAQGYDKSGVPVKPIEMSLFPAAGAMKASANDMQHFLSAAIGLPGTPERIFYPMRLTQTAFVRLADKDQGLGWQIHPITTQTMPRLLNEPDSMNFGPVPVAEIYDKPTYNGNALIDKTGATDGFRTYVAVIPNKKSGIVILTNKYVSNGQLVNTGRELLFKLANVTPNEASVSVEKEHA